MDARPLKYNIVDENGSVVFRYGRSVFLPTSSSIGSYTFPILKIAVVAGGVADWRFKSALYRVKSGDIVLLRAGVPRSIEKIYPEGSLECDIYEFVPEFVRYGISPLAFFYADSDGRNDVLSGGPELLGLFDRISREMKLPGTMCGELVRGLLTAALVLIGREIGPAEADKGGKLERVAVSSESDPVYDYDRRRSGSAVTSASTHAFDMAYISNYIERRISGEIDIGELARAAHMSRSYFYKIFRQYNGMSVNDYILKRRVEKTVRLLLSSECSVIDAAYQSGFTSGAGFYKTFRRLTGTSPREYLKQYHTEGRT